MNRIPIARRYNLRCSLIRNRSFLSGLAYDLKTVSAEMIRKRIDRTGDGTHPWAHKSKQDLEDHDHPENPVWGWDDQDMPEEDKKLAEIVHRKTE